MSFTPLPSATFTPSGRRERAVAPDWPRSLLLPTERRVVEFGTGSGERGEQLLRAGPALSYDGFEPCAGWEQASRGRLRPFGERARVRAWNLLDPLPLPEGGADLLLTVDLLECLRMDQLYLVCLEARRVLRPGGRWVVRGLSPGPGWLDQRLAEAWGALANRRPAWAGNRRPLELTHYFSPEDWQTLSDRKLRNGCVTLQTTVLARSP